MAPHPASQSACRKVPRKVARWQRVPGTAGAGLALCVAERRVAERGRAMSPAAEWKPKMRSCGQNPNYTRRTAGAGRPLGGPAGSKTPDAGRGGTRRRLRLKGRGRIRSRSGVRARLGTIHGGSAAPSKRGIAPCRKLGGRRTGFQPGSAMLACGPHPRSGISGQDRNRPGVRRSQERPIRLPQPRGLAKLPKPPRPAHRTSLPPLPRTHLPSPRPPAPGPRSMAPVRPP